MTLQKTVLAIVSMCLCVGSYAQDQTAIPNKKPDIISVIQFQFTENGLGFGASFERVIDRKGIVSFYIPVMATFNVANSNRIYDYNTGNYKTGKADAMCYSMPGIKFYPAGCYGKVKYAVGLSLVVGTGQESNNLANINGLNVTEQIQSHFIAGGMIQNSLNINMGKSLYLGVELGLGSSFINSVGGVNSDNKFLIQGGFKIGYRF